MGQNSAMIFTVSTSLTTNFGGIEHELEASPGPLPGRLTLGGALTACGTPTASTPEETSAPAAEVQALAATSQALTAPKYVFLFIGDGMSYPQIQSTSDYLGALADEDYWQAQPSLDDNGGAVLDGPEYLNFMNFEGVGSAVTYDSNSFAPDSASTATSLSTGHKTYSGSINVDETGTVEYETISEKLHSQKGYSIGVITSVNLNHATPAAFYAHQASRNDYYDIGLELVDSGFEYFAGGGPAGSRRRRGRPGEPVRPGRAGRLQRGDHPGRGREGHRRPRGDHRRAPGRLRRHGL